jgi:hypothetical protein
VIFTVHNLKGLSKNWFIFKGMETIIFKLSDNGCGNNTTIPISVTTEPNALTQNITKSEPTTASVSDPRLPTEQTIESEPTRSLP